MLWLAKQQGCIRLKILRQNSNKVKNYLAIKRLFRLDKIKVGKIIIARCIARYAQTLVGEEKLL